MYKIAFVVTALLLALIAGLFYSYSCSVNPGLGRLPDSGYIQSMQSINRAILNPGFFVSFMGTLIMIPVSAWLCYKNEGTGTSFYLLLAASIIYIVGVFGVTIMGNVPLNEALDKFVINTATPGQIKMERMRFEISWNRWHAIRTFSNISSLLLFLIAFIKK